MIIPTKYKWVYVDEKGVVYSTARKGEMRPLAPSRGGTGGKYLQVSVIHPDGVRRSTLVHKIMCEAWHGERPEPIDGHKFTVSHINGDKYDNRRDNLMWEPVQSNLARKRGHGTDDSGYRNSRAKLSEDQLVEIRRRLASGEVHGRIAEDYGVSRGAISKINNRSRYGNV